ncbi:hypothetical protein BD779DRAFT_1474250 [Infundibulicybe gibba]|nr:hypothetical protein BD779DRAFT_1474250 [Infundibulicybe gibba]
MSQSEQIDIFTTPASSCPQETIIRELCLAEPQVIPGYLRPKVYLGWYIRRHHKGIIHLAKEHFSEMLRRKDGQFRCICERYRVPEGKRHQVDVVDVVMKGRNGLAVVIGNNIDGRLSKDLIKQISNDLFKGRRPVWSLDPYDWEFVRSRRS